jgi:hypothetical protein
VRLLEFEVRDRRSQGKKVNEVMKRGSSSTTSNSKDISSSNQNSNGKTSMTIMKSNPSPLHLPDNLNSTTTEGKNRLVSNNDKLSNGSNEFIVPSPKTSARGEFTFLFLGNS